MILIICRSAFEKWQKTEYNYGAYSEQSSEELGFNWTVSRDGGWGKALEW
jgi:hypothetical protein